MSEDQFTKLFKYIEQRFDGVERRQEKEHEEHVDIRGAIGELGAQIRDHHHEMIFLSH
ncbi:MAG TPA: hypothetical protein VGM08_00290 [Candidatus Saccharimonadales bacterium]|jgi:hypothetical protein